MSAEASVMATEESVLAAEVSAMAVEAGAMAAEAIAMVAEASEMATEVSAMVAELSVMERGGVLLSIETKFADVFERLRIIFHSGKYDIFNILNPSITSSLPRGPNNPI